MTFGGENGTDGTHFLVFSENIAFAHHFLATHPPNRSAGNIGYISKKLSKMVGNPAIYPVYSRYN